MSLFAHMASLADRLAIEPGRLKKRAEIVDAIRRIAGVQPEENTVDGAVADGPPKELSPAALADAGLLCLYLSGQPFSEADPRKLNAGGALLSRALKEVSQCTDAALNAAYRRHGDLGAAAFDVLHATAPATRTITFAEVAEAFDAMAAARTTAARSAVVTGLLRRATAVEAKYLLKLMLADMRIGVKQSLIEEAIAEAASTATGTVSAVQVRHAVMLEADLARSVVMAFTSTLAAARMRLFHPLGFMLASPVETPEEAVERFTAKPAKEPKQKVPKPKMPKGARRKKIVDDAAALEAEAEAMGTGALALDEVDAGVHRNSQEPGEPSTTETQPHEAWHIAQQQDGRGPQAFGVHAFIEDKYDGMRAQLHCGDPAQLGRVALYSRNREDITHSFPEIAEAFAHVAAPQGPQYGPLILDGEILGWDTAANQALPFAVLGQRIGRKNVDDDLRRQIPVVFMAFDLLFQGDGLLLDLPLRERRERLETLHTGIAAQTVSGLRAAPPDAPQIKMFAAAPAVEEVPVARFLLSPARLVESAEEIDRAYADARAKANEGVMLKAAESTYQPGRRGLAWVKLKRTLDTLDVVMTGAEYGHGRRAGLLSDYTFAVRGAGGELLNVGKAYSGVTDAEIAELTEWCKLHTLEDHGHFRTVEPLRVLEVGFNNIMRSTRHSSGFALRFPRIVQLRTDKPLDEIDTVERVEEIYQSQPDKPVES
jgi:DNA ligase-1